MSLSKQENSPVAVITGASSGIGEAIARLLADKGYRIAICARRQNRLEHLASELRASGCSVLSQGVDLRQESEILKFFNQIRNTWGKIDVLINNAGLGFNQPLLTGETEAWREMLEVNILALCICTREAVKTMIETEGKGHIIHINSMSGHRVPADSAVYAATKYAVTALTEALRQEINASGHNIKVSAISPGFVETEFAEKYHNSSLLAQKTYSQYPVLQPSDIAEAVWYVLSQPDRVQIHDILLRPTKQPD